MYYVTFILGLDWESSFCGSALDGHQRLEVPSFVLSSF